jgi:hypothetical protein
VCVATASSPVGAGNRAPIKETDISHLRPSSVAKPSNEFDFLRLKFSVRPIFDRFVDRFFFSRALFEQKQGFRA